MTLKRIHDYLTPQCAQANGGSLVTAFLDAVVISVPDRAWERTHIPVVERSLLAMTVYMCWMLFT
jgi:hypothetical protein